MRRPPQRTPRSGCCRRHAARHRRAARARDALRALGLGSAWRLRADTEVGIISRPGEETLLASTPEAGRLLARSVLGPVLDLPDEEQAV